MFRSVDSKFVIISGLLTLIFIIFYSTIVYFHRVQNESTYIVQGALSVEREVGLLHENLLRARFWEKAIVLHENPEADKKFGELLAQAKISLDKLYTNKSASFIQKDVESILTYLNQYEDDFNKINQLRIAQRLHSTRMDTSYESLASFVLRSNDDSLLKSLFNLTRFHNNYRIDRRESEYQAILLVANALKNKITEDTPGLDKRAIEYLNNFTRLLEEDFNLENELIKINSNFHQTANKISDFHDNIFNKSKELLGGEFAAVQENRKLLKTFSLTFFVISLAILYVVLLIFFKKIITPIRSVAGVMREVKAGKIDERYSGSSDKSDEIVEFCLSFNDMLDTLQSHNNKLIEYKEDLEQKVLDIEHRSVELSSTNEELENEITERKKLEGENEEIQEQLLRLNENLQDMVDEQTLKIQEREKQLLHAEKLSAVGRLSASIAHEFNNPLQGIVNVFRGVERRATLTGNDMELVKLAIKECDRMKNLVHNLKQFEKPSSEVEKEIDIHHVIDEVLLFSSKEFKSKNITLAKEYGRDLPRMWMVEDQIKQVLLNLLSNACDAITSDNGRVSITTTSLNNRSIAIAIKDSGQGIKAEHLQHIFEPFYSTKADAGTGLGLYTSYGIVESHGGDIKVESEVDRGTTFTIILPIARRTTV